MFGFRLIKVEDYERMESVMVSQAKKITDLENLIGKSGQAQREINNFWTRRKELEVQAEIMGDSVVKLIDAIKAVKAIQAEAFEEARK